MQEVEGYNMNGFHRPFPLAAFTLLAAVTVALGMFLFGGSLRSEETVYGHAPGNLGMDVSSASVALGADATVTIVLHDVPANQMTGYNLSVSYPAAALTRKAPTTSSCMLGFSGPHSGATGLPPYSAGCADLANPPVPVSNCSPGPCTLATIVFTCNQGGVHALDLDATSAAYGDAARNEIIIADPIGPNGGGGAATDGSINCMAPPTSTPTRTLTPTLTPTATPTITETPTPTFTPTPVPDPDVLVEKIANPNPAPNEGVVDFTIRVRNNGLGPATGVLMADPFPPGTTFLSAPDPLCVMIVGGIACGFFDLAANDLVPGGPDEHEFHMFLQMPDVVVDTTVTNTAQAIASNEPPANQTNNAGSVNVLVIAPPPPDLVISKSATPVPAEALGNVTYTLHVRNIGPGTAASVMISDPLPPGTMFVAAGTSPECSETAGVVNCTGGNLTADDLSPGGTDEVMRTVVMKMPNGHVDQSVMNNASVSTIDEPPANTGNNTGSHTILVRGCPDIDNDGDVDFNDLLILAQAYSSMAPNPPYNPNADFNQDGKVNFQDLLRLAQRYNGMGGPCTPLP